jgi:4-alpha-glucanotransferase
VAAAMHDWLDRRRSAVLLHITSLPGPFHKGVLGAEARQFIDAIAAAGFSVWQFLPLGPTHGHGSPYESISAFAGNPELIDLRECVKQGWLDQTSLAGCNLAEHQSKLLDRAGSRFWNDITNNPELADLLAAFRQENRYWLNDYTLFVALKRVLQNRAWWQWPEELRDRNENAMATARQQHISLIRQVIFEQFLFHHQWQVLKTYAESRQVQLFGDLPIYVAHDSSDVWANRQYFTVNELGLCNQVAGVPPDYFSKTGQRWGNPQYCWDKLEQREFDWWVKRVKCQLNRMHMMRIDHFRGLEASWSIPGESEDGIIGKWVDAPGHALLQRLENEIGRLPLIAEDLGSITDEVIELRETFGLPGMKILQFAFGGDKNNPYLPANHIENCVIYTGTHDNDTTMGWFDSADENTRRNTLHVLADARSEEMPWALIECTLASPARLAVIPMQDLLELGSEARFNTPGTLENNWFWRMQKIPGPSASCWIRSKQLNRKYLRA